MRIANAIGIPGQRLAAVGPAPPVVDEMYVLSWGAKLDSHGRYAIALGKASDGDHNTLEPKTEHTVPKAGDIKALSYNTKAGDVTSVLKLIVNGLVTDTITLTGLVGADTTLSRAIAVGDQLAIEFDSGTDPKESILDIYVE